MRILVDPSARIAISPGEIEVFEPLAVAGDQIVGEVVAEFLEALDPAAVEGLALDRAAETGENPTAAILATLAAMAREQYQ